MENFLKEEMNKLEIQLNDKQITQFLTYYELLVEWNKFMNLTAITDFKEVVQKHFVDSLSIVKALDQKYLQTGNISVIDIGTGAGFPGIPLKIVFSGLNITLLDSLNKRIKFLDNVIEELSLKDIKAIHGRAEDYARRENFREQYDICVSRAVAKLITLSEYSLPFVKIGGYFISYKSENIEEEIDDSKNAIKLLGGSLNEVVKFILPDTDIKRSIVTIKKEKMTNKKYPRKSGIPSKEPLK
jgi:16S rRNA (guanine527-N7)-methyltransferase